MVSHTGTRAMDERTRLVLARSKIDEIIHEAMGKSQEKGAVQISFIRLQKITGLSEPFSLPEARELLRTFQREGFRVSLPRHSLYIKWRLQ